MGGQIPRTQRKNPARQPVLPTSSSIQHPADAVNSRVYALA
jgi:hypothetical protein